MSVKRIMVKSKRAKGKTNWKKVRALSEKQIIFGAKSDCDAKPLSVPQLKKFKRVNSPKEKVVDANV